MLCTDCDTFITVNDFACMVNCQHSVRITVKGKTYTAKTNSKGKAIFKIKNLKKKGTYKATVTYKGDKNYNKVIKTVKITVK